MYRRIFYPRSLCVPPPTFIGAPPLASDPYCVPTVDDYEYEEDSEAEVVEEMPDAPPLRREQSYVVLHPGSIEEHQFTMVNNAAEVRDVGMRTHRVG